MTDIAGGNLCFWIFTFTLSWSIMITSMSDICTAHHVTDDKFDKLYIGLTGITRV